MIKVDLHRQQTLLVNLSLLISVLLLFLRWSFFPHSSLYAFLYSLNSLKSSHHNVFLDQSIFFLLVWIAFLVLSFLSIHFLMKGFKRYKYKAVIPLAINIFTLVLLLVIHNLTVLQDYYSNVKDRDAVVTMIKSGKLKPDDSQRITRLDNLNHVLHKIYKLQLPSQYTDLSQGGGKGGEINIITNKKDQTKIIVFFTSFDKVNYTAWLYKLNPLTPIENYLFGVGNLKSYAWLLETKQINDHWSWVDVVEN